MACLRNMLQFSQKWNKNNPKKRVKSTKIKLKRTKWNEIKRNKLQQIWVKLYY